MALRTVKDYLKEMSSNTDLNVDGLLDIIKNNRIPIKFHEFPQTIPAAALTLDKGIYLNSDVFGVKYSKSGQYHIILHEIGHYLRLKKLGKKNFESKIKSCTTHVDYYQHILFEEMFAEKFAALTYYKLNGSRDESGIRVNFRNGGAQQIYMYTKYAFKDIESIIKVGYFNYHKQMVNIK